MFCTEQRVVSEVKKRDVQTPTGMQKRFIVCDGINDTKTDKFSLVKKKRKRTWLFGVFHQFPKLPTLLETM